MENINNRNFGHPISLKYRQNSTFKTTFGGFVTIAFKIGILIYLVFELIKVVDKTYTVTNSMIKRNLFVDNGVYTINEENFDIGFSMYGLSEEQQANLDNYVNITFQQGQFEWSADGKSYTFEGKQLQLGIALNLLIFNQLGKCGRHRFKGEVFQAESIGIPYAYKCPVNFSASLQGSFTTQKMQSARLLISKCNQTNLSLKNQSAKCMNDSMMKNFFDSFQVNVVATNQFIDVNEKQISPIKTVLKNFYATGYHNMSLSYQLKIGQNFLISSTSSLSNQLGQLNQTYYTVRDDVLQVAAQTLSTDLVFINFNMMLDDNVMTTNLELYTISDALSNTGGIIGIVMIIIQFLVSQTQENLYYQQLVQDIFQINKEDSISQNGSPSKSRIIPSEQTLKDKIIQDGYQGSYQKILTFIKN
ncbi:UNKNOWN [Stylonychia lemnae]|uniref:Transmembrane protein n=1 Tax=Stylonychia lemnae TaxID=5949 RepID=A0A078AB48_STYLE|nr:UNKNOWN [Stylonychia lemnae]|eukprot:CDW79510.1 UNKNOWN [Stylonychia lemnae]